MIMPTSLDDTLVNQLWTALHQAVDEEAWRTARLLAETLGAALVEVAYVSGPEGIDVFAGMIKDHADSQFTDDLAWVLWESTHRHLRYQREGIHGCQSGKCGIA